MTSPDALLAEIYGGQAPLSTFVQLAGLLQQCPADVITSVNELTVAEGRALLDACAQQPLLGLPLLRSWLLQGENFDSRALESYCCRLVKEYAQQQQQQWQERRSDLIGRTAEAAVAIKNLDQLQVEQAEIQQRYALSRDGAEQVRTLLAEKEAISAALRQLETVDRAHLEREIHDLGEQHRQLERQTEQLKLQHEELRTQLDNRRREAQQALHVEIDRLRTKLEQIQYIHARFTNQPRAPQGALSERVLEAQEELARLRRLVFDGELEQQLQRAQDTWRDILKSLRTQSIAEE